MRQPDTSFDGLAQELRPRLRLPVPRDSSRLQLRSRYFEARTANRG